MTWAQCWKEQRGRREGAKMSLAEKRGWDTAVTRSRARIRRRTQHSKNTNMPKLVLMQCRNNNK